MPSGAPAWVLVLICVIVIAGAILAFLLYSPGPRYQWVAMQDTVDAYESYISEFEGTPEAKKAYQRLRELQEDAVWAQTGAAPALPELRNYLRVYPDGKHAAEAQAQITKLMDDWEWVKKQDRVEYYRAFAAKFPNHPEAAWLEKKIIELEMLTISKGEHGEMPPSVAVSLGGGVANLEVENQTGSVLTVLYHGAESKRLVVPVGEKGKVTLKPGNYEVAAFISGKAAKPFYCNDSLQAGEYQVPFSIVKRQEESIKNRTLRDLLPPAGR